MVERGTPTTGLRPVRSDPQLVARHQDGLDRRLGQGPRRLMRAGGPILESIQALVAIAADPLGRGLAGHPGGFRRPSDRPPVGVHAVDQQPPTEHGQLRPTMCHESLRLVWDLDTPKPVARLSFVNNVFVNHS